jgi:hypothetical protein
VRLPAKFKANPPADPRAIENVGIDLPEDYREFLRLANGGEGFLENGAYAQLWRAERLVTINREYEVPEFAPEAFFFGSNGGGEGYAFDRRSDPMRIVAIPFVGMEMKVALHLAGSFTSFLVGGWVFGGEPAP